MKKALATTIFFLVFQICTADYWTQKADLPTAGRSSAIAFVIGNYGYVGTGAQAFDDLWQYAPLINNWTAKAVVPNQPRFGAVAASCNGKGYVGLGNSIGFQNDWWEYDPVADTWTQKNNFPGSQRELASAFTINTSVFVGCGLDTVGPQRDWWRFDTGNNNWVAIDSTPGIAHSGLFACVSFSLLEKGYVITGYGGGKQVFEYDPITGVWNSNNFFPGTQRYGASGFAIGDYGYIGTGDTGFMTPQVKDFWQYDPSTDLWYQKNDFSGVARNSAISFSIGSKGYLGMGYMLGVGQLTDLWEYTPDSVTSVSEISNSQIEFLISPNPTKDKLIVNNIPSAITQLEIYNLLGKKIGSWYYAENKNEITIDVSDLTPGIYIIQATSGEKTWRGKVVKE